MKKLLIILFLNLLFNNLAFSVLTGLGTFNNPLSGNVDPGDLLLTPTTYSSNTIYFGNVTILSSATLTIGEGLTVLTRNLGSTTINIYGTLMINAGASFTARTFTNNGTLILGSSDHELGSASIIFLSGYSGGGTTLTQLYLSGGSYSIGGNTYYRWHFISTPISGLDVDHFTVNTLNLYQYIESRVNNEDNSAGWVAYDGYEDLDGTMTGITFNQMLLGRGYNYYNLTGIQYTLTGSLNFSDVDIDLTCGSGYIDYQGYNLIGNPFPSYLDWDLMWEDLPIGMNDAIYITSNDQVVSYVGGLGQGTGASNYIPPMQGFFVKANSSVTMTIPASARAHDPAHQIRYKGDSKNEKGSDSIPHVRLNLYNSTDSTDLVVRFNNKATPAVDKRFDAYKFSKTGSILGAWTTTENVDFAINGLPFPETSVEIPVGIFTAAGGICKLSSKELKNLDGYSISLKDLIANVTIDLNKGESMVFNVPAGLTENRFILTVSNLTTSDTDIYLPDKKFSIYSSNGFINVLPLTDEFSNNWGGVNIYDLAGRKLYQQNNVKWQANGELMQIMFNSVDNGLVIVEIKAGNKRYVEKVNLL